MTEENKEINNLSDLYKLSENEENKVVQNEPKMDTLGRSYATGRRKESTARVWVKRGTGKILINGKEMINYFARPVLQMKLNFVFDWGVKIYILYFFLIDPLKNIISAYFI